MIEQRELLNGVGGMGGSIKGELAEEQQPRRLHFEVLLKADNYPLSQIVTHLVERAMRTYPTGCEIVITSRV
jgi:hypothetical protein